MNCIECDGIGIEYLYDPYLSKVRTKTCAFCKGTGKLEISQQKGNDHEVHTNSERQL